jgi:hypothetical protein
MLHRFLIRFRLTGELSEFRCRASHHLADWGALHSLQTHTQYRRFLGTGESFISRSSFAVPAKISCNQPTQPSSERLSVLLKLARYFNGSVPKLNTSVLLYLSLDIHYKISLWGYHPFSCLLKPGFSVGASVFCMLLNTALKGVIWILLSHAPSVRMFPHWSHALFRTHVLRWYVFPHWMCVSMLSLNLTTVLNELNTPLQDDFKAVIKMTGSAASFYRYWSYTRLGWREAS